MNPTTRFTDRADDYRAARPSYGSDAIDFILADLHDPIDVADLGAGTGISSRLLATRNARVAAVEPNAAMRDASEAHAGVRYIAGSAQETGLADRSVDLVTAFQAFHWFDGERVLREIERILRPGGRAALVLNERDESDAFTAAYGQIVRRYATDDTERRREQSIVTFKRFRGTLTEREFKQRQTLDLAQLARRTASASYLPRDGVYAVRLQTDVEDVFTRFARRGTIDIALRTIVVRIDVAGVNLPARN